MSICYEFTTTKTASVFKEKVIEAHHDRLYGTDSHASSSSDDSDHKMPLDSPASKQEHCDYYESSNEETSKSLHEVHQTFIKEQLKQAQSYNQSRTRLPQTVSSKRPLEGTAGKDRAAPPEKCALLTDGSETGKGQRVVPSKEKNRRRKEKRRRAKEKRIQNLG